MARNLPGRWWTAPRPASPRWLRGRVSLCFFLSGVSALVLEVVWSRAFGLILGNSLEGTAVVAAGFLGGLGLGAALGGRIADRLNRPLLAYASVEAAIGVWALGGVVFLPRAAAIVSSLGGGDPTAWSLVALRAALAIAFLAPPTLLMGLGLPLLAAGAHRAVAFVSGLGFLYGVNTLGAAAGALLAGFVLLPGLGASGPAVVAALVSFLIFPIVWREDSWVAAGTSTFEPKPLPGAYGRWFLGPTFLATGAVALCSEMAWTRGLGLILGGSTYAFSLILVVLLAGIGVGSLWWRAYGRPLLDPAGTYGWLLIALALTIIGSIVALDRAGDVFLFLYPRLATRRAAILLSFVGPAAVTAAPAALLLGLAFPVTGEILRYAGRASGAAAGRALLWNAAGSLLGSLAAGFVLLPRLGTSGTLRAAAALALPLGVAWVASRHEMQLPRRAGVIAGSVVLALVLLWQGPRLLRLHRDQGMFRIVTPALAAQKGAGLPDHVRSRLRERRYFFEKEGRLSTVAVWHVSGNLVLALGGKADASYEDMETQVLLGQIPMLFAPRPRNGLVIGYGSGVTARALLTHDLTELDVAEIEPAVLEGARYFEHLAGRVAERAGVRVLTVDGRSLLAYGRRAYDLVVSEPSNPWLGANNSLFTEEFYRLVRERLAPEGIFVQWFPLYEGSPETLFVLLRSLERVFPDFFLVQSGSDLIAVVGRDRLPRWSAAAGERAPEEARAQLLRVGIEDPEDIFVRILADATLTVPSGPLNTDENGWVEFRAPWELPVFAVRSHEPQEVSGLSSPPLALWRRLGFPIDAASIARLVRAALLREDATLARAVLEEWTGEKAADLEAAVAAAEMRRNRKGDVEPLFAQAAAHLAKKETGEAVAKMEAAYALDPMDPRISGPLSFFLIGSGRLDEARAILERELRRGVSSTRVVTLLNLALIEEREGRSERAEAYAREAVAADPYREEAYIFLGKAFLREGRNNEATAILTEGVRLNPDLVGIRRFVREQSR